MRALYLFGGLMVIGVGLMLASSYKILNVLDQAKLEGTKFVAQSGVQTYVTLSYVGVGMFLLGAVGAIIVMLRGMSRQ